MFVNGLWMLLFKIFQSQQKLTHSDKKYANVTALARLYRFQFLCLNKLKVLVKEVLKFFKALK